MGERPPVPQEMPPPPPPAQPQPQQLDAPATPVVPQAQQAPAAAHPPIAWRLLVLPSTFPMSRRGAVRIRIVATNTGHTTVDPERDPLEIHVNGQSSMEANMAFGNGGREARWSALPAGETVEEDRVGLELFPRPGNYDLVLHVPAGDVARTRVHVTANGAEPAGDS